VIFRIVFFDVVIFSHW